MESSFFLSEGKQRVYGQAARERRQRTLLLLALLLVVLGSLTYGLAYVIHDVRGGLLLGVAVLGMLIGWAMASSRLPGWLSGILASVLGLGVVLVRVGRLEGKLVAVLQALARLYWEIWRWLLDGPPPDWASVAPPLAELWTDIAALLGRLLDWALMLSAGEPVFDLVATALVWCLITWAMAFWASWWLRRRRPLLGVAPAGALLVATFHYAGAKSFALLPLMGTTLLLMALIAQDTREGRWQAAGVSFSRDIWGNLARTAILLALALVVVAATIPSVSAQQIVEFVQRLTADQEGDTKPVAESLGLEVMSEPGGEAFVGVRIAGLPRSHLVGGDPSLSRTVVMVIRTDDLRPNMPEPPHRYYWRSITYDYYNGRGWATSQTETRNYAAGEPANSADTPFHRAVQQEVRVIADLGEMIHAAGNLVTVDSDYQVAWRHDGDALGATTEAAIYHADSLVPVVGKEQLRSTGSDYPQWVLARHLTLPDEVPERVLTLAHDLTVAEATPYDRALAIESYLRAFPYTLDVPLTPPGRDVADYFLFDLQRGYCDYYATAMVVLARAAGLPSRLAIGYATGTYEAENARFVVTEADAHAWVEVYFPGYGWVEFEPTGSRPPIERPEVSRPFEWPELEEPLGAQERAEQTTTVRLQLGRLWWLWVPSGLALLALVGTAWSKVARWRLRLSPPTTTLGILYRRLRRHARRLGIPTREGDTPHEFAAAFTAHVGRLAKTGAWGEVWARATQEARLLTELYVQASYTTRPPDAAEQAEAIRIWQQLGKRLWMARVWRRLGRTNPRRQRPKNQAKYGDA